MKNFRKWCTHTDVFPCLHLTSELTMHAWKAGGGGKTKYGLAIFCNKTTKTFTDKTNKASMKERLAYMAWSYTEVVENIPILYFLCDFIYFFDKILFWFCLQTT